MLLWASYAILNRSPWLHLFAYFLRLKWWIERLCCIRNGVLGVWLGLKLTRNKNISTTSWVCGCIVQLLKDLHLIASFMGKTWGPSGAGRPQVGPMLVPWTLLSGTVMTIAAPGNRFGKCSARHLCQHRLNNYGRYRPTFRPLFHMRWVLLQAVRIHITSICSRSVCCLYYVAALLGRVC